MKNLPRHFLLTGVTGFIGSEVLLQLLEKVAPEDMTLLVRKKPVGLDSVLGQRILEHRSPEEAKKLFERLHFVVCDFLNEKTFQACLEQISEKLSSHLVIVHMAAQVKAPSSEKSAQERVNVGVTGDLVRWGEKHASHFVYVSSVVAFGATLRPRLRSESDLKNFSWLSSKMSYFQTKRLSHLAVLEAKIPAVSVVCPSIVHGTLEDAKASRGHLKAVKEGRLSWAPPGGLNIVSLKYVAKNIVALAVDEKRKGAETFLLAGENLPTVKYLQAYQDAHGTKAGLRIRRLPYVAGTPLLLIFIFCKLLRIPTSTSFETAVASFGYLYFKSQQLVPDENIKL